LSIDCEEPDTVHYSTSVGDDTVEGSIVQYTCIDSHTISTDDASISCINGEWSGDVSCAARA
jgi:hypothetical protein